MNILDTNINQLKKDQLEALTEHVEKTLNEIMFLFKERQFNKIKDRFIKYSPAGDDMGCDNHFINFAWNDDETKDILDIIDMAEGLTEEKTEKKKDDFDF